MLDALADREDVGVGRLHVVVDDDAAVDGEAGLDARGRRSAGCRRRPRPDRLRRPLPSAERHAFDVAVAEDRRRRAAEQHADAELLHLAEQVAGRRPDRAAAPSASAIRCTTVTSQPCTCRPRAASRPSRPPPITTAFGPGPDRRISSRVSSSVRNAKTPSLSSPSIGGIHAELPVASSSVSYGVTLPSSPVTVLARGSTSTMRTPTRRSMSLLAIPLERIDDDVVGGLLAGEHRRQHDAVVVDVRLVAEDGDVELRLVLEDLLEAGHAGHAVADDDQSLHRTRLRRAVRLFRPAPPTACSWARARTGRTRSASPGWRWPRRSGTARTPGPAPPSR